jgi:hypothetical protein
MMGLLAAVFVSCENKVRVFGLQQPILSQAWHRVTASHGPSTKLQRLAGLVI